MKKEGKLLWAVAGLLSTSMERSWEALLASMPEFAGQDIAALANGAVAQKVSIAVGAPPVTTMDYLVDPLHMSVTLEGQWWYRGVTSVEAHASGSLIAHRVYNIAPGLNRWLVRFVHHHDQAAFRRQHETLVLAMAARLGCEGHLVSAEK